MRRLETKQIMAKMPEVAVTKNLKKYSQSGRDITDVLDTDEDRVMLYYKQDKNDTSLLKRSRREYHA